MNARTSRLLRRVAFAVNQVENRVAKLEGKPPTSQFKAQLTAIKRSWQGTPRHERGTTRVRLVGIFNTIVAGEARA